MWEQQRNALFTMALAFVLVCLLVMPRLSAGAIKEVTIFPNSAEIEETVKLTAHSSETNNNQAVITLPSSADPESLIVSLPSSSLLKIEDIQIKSIEIVDEADILRLREQIKKLQNQRKEIQAGIQSLELQLQFWQAQTKAKTKNLVEANNLAAAIGKNSRKDYSEKYSAEADLIKIDKQIKELQEELNRSAGKSEKSWQATIALSGPLSNNQTLNYSYTLQGCGWQPLYRLEAIPSAQNIIFSWDAEIWQSTGKDWQSVPINLATLQPVRTITPPELPPWVIKPKTAVVFRSAARQEKALPAMLSMEAANDSAGQAQPVETVHTTYSSWSLGKKTIVAGQKQRLKIKQESWPAQFLYLARPSVSPQAFLQAEIKLTSPVEIPSGTATFVIDGALIGKRQFALAGTKADIYFGNSPFVTVKSSTIADKSDVATFFQNKQIRQWQWLIEAKNAGNAPIRLRIEEPVPEPRDERIKLTFQHQPPPSEKDHAKFVWMVDLPALQKKSIETGIKLEAPGDMHLDFGWRR